MRKEIRLLVEGFFNDDIFNPNDINQDIQDIGDQYYNYKEGEIYYKVNQPYAVCCGDKSKFKDKCSRFCLYDFDYERCIWGPDEIIPEFKLHNQVDPGLLLFTNILLDENGYENTRIIWKNYNIYNFEAFRYCVDLGDNVYLPAIDELKICWDNLNKINILENEYWSSTLYDKSYVFHLKIKKQNNTIFISKKNNMNFVLPFVKID